MDAIIIITAYAGLYFIAIYWVNMVTQSESKKIRCHLERTEEKLDRLLAVLDTAETQANEVISRLDD